MSSAPPGGGGDLAPTEVGIKNWKIILLISGIGLAACGLHYLAFTIERFFARRGRSGAGGFIEYIRWPTFFIIPPATFLGMLSILELPDAQEQTAKQVLTVLLIFGVGYLAMNIIKGVSGILIENNRIKEDDVNTKIAQTQVYLLRRFCYGFVVVLVLACIFFTFPSAWQVGASMFASAGIFGLMVGMAAKPVLENAFASFVIAITNPVLLDDEVFIREEYGRVEAIRSTFIVVRTWDARRLLVPLTYVLSDIFENWSRTSPWKIGTVYMYVDSDVDIGILRDIFINEALPAAGELWDGAVANLSVTQHMKDGKVELRLIASSINTGTSFDLKSFIREYMLAQVRLRWPYSLSKERVEIVPTVVMDEEKEAYDDGENYKEGSQKEGYFSSTIGSDDFSKGLRQRTVKRTPTVIQSSSIRTKDRIDTTRKVVQGRLAETPENENPITDNDDPKESLGISGEDDTSKGKPGAYNQPGTNFALDKLLNPTMHGSNNMPSNSTGPRASNAGTLAHTILRNKPNKNIVFQTPMSALCEATIPRDNDVPNDAIGDPFDANNIGMTVRRRNDRKRTSSEIYFERDKYIRTPVVTINDTRGLTDQDDSPDSGDRIIDSSSIPSLKRPSIGTQSWSRDQGDKKHSTISKTMEPGQHRNSHAKRKDSYFANFEDIDAKPIHSSSSIKPGSEKAGDRKQSLDIKITSKEDVLKLGDNRTIKGDYQDDSTSVFSKPRGERFSESKRSSGSRHSRHH